MTTSFVYEGRRVRVPVHAVVLVRSADGSCMPLPPRLDLYSHSPTGLEWGYRGSGPKQTALAILAHHVEHAPHDILLLRRAAGLADVCATCAGCKVVVYGDAGDENEEPCWECATKHGEGTLRALLTRVDQLLLEHVVARFPEGGWVLTSAQVVEALEGIAVLVSAPPAVHDAEPIPNLGGSA